MACEDEFYHLYGDADYEHATDDSMYDPDDPEDNPVIRIENTKRIAKSYPAFFRRKKNE